MIIATHEVLAAMIVSYCEPRWDHIGIAINLIVFSEYFMFQKMTAVSWKNTCHYFVIIIYVCFKNILPTDKRTQI